MKKKDIRKLDYIEKRNLKYSSSFTPAEKLEFAQYSLNKGNMTDPADIYANMGKKDELIRLIQRAIAEGDYFHYKYISKLCKRELDPGEIRETIKNAEAKGFTRYAAEASGYLDENALKTNNMDNDNKKRDSVSPSRKKRQ